MVLSSSLIFPVSIQLILFHLSKTIPFPKFCSKTLVINQVYMYVWICFCPSYSVALFYLSAFAPIHTLTLYILEMWLRQPFSL